jgi:predicted metal-dependent peptidase
MSSVCEAARIQLILKNGLFGSIALTLEEVATLDIPTIATNGKKLFVSPEFWGSLSLQEQVFALAHECVHVLLHHCGVRGHVGWDPKLWNVAVDVVTNHVLAEQRLGKMPEGCIWEPELYAKGDGIPEKIYRLLEEEGGNGGEGEGEGGEGEGEGGEGGRKPWDDVTVEPLDEEAENEVKVRVQQACLAAGDVPGDLGRMLKRLTEVKVPWTDVLRDYLHRSQNEDRSFSRPNRRFASQGMYLPSVEDEEELGKVAVCLDTSGSTWGSQNMLERFATEVAAIVEDLNPSSVVFIQHDTHVRRESEHDKGEVPEFEVVGGGGTSFIGALAAAGEHDPEVCIMLTDLYGPMGDEPEFPVIWCSTGRTEAEFGRVISVEV